MDNREILETFRLTARLMDLHEENPFKVRGYANAGLNLEKVEQPFSTLSSAELEAVAGKTFAGRITQLLSGKKLPELEALLAATPEGVVRLMDVKGLGPKKVRALWKEYSIESPERLLEACDANELAGLKGFGEKTQQTIKESLEFNRANAGKLLFSEAEALAAQLLGSLKLLLPGMPEGSLQNAGDLRLKAEIIEQLSFMAASDKPGEVHTALSKLPELQYEPLKSGPYAWRGTLKPQNLPVEFLISSENRFVSELFLHSAKTGHLLHQAEGVTLLETARKNTFRYEQDLYAQAGLPYIVPEMREGLNEWDWVSKYHNTDLLETKHLKGILHNHSTYSDGNHSLEQMALECRRLGYHYLGISDHSQTASYAGGLDADRVAQQQVEIDKLNKELAPFRIFKGIESDILPDGSLDYEPEVLASFDFIVASVHSVLNMDEEKATRRLITAIENPFTTFLGHPTGRLLLKRSGYPIDHKAVIDACAKHNVIIEINANPWRLDIDWRWVYYAMEQGVMLSINPDAHDKAGYADMYYGVCAGRKGGLTKAFTFNSKSTEEVAAWFTQKRKAAGVQV